MFLIQFFLLCVGICTETSLSFETTPLTLNCYHDAVSASPAQADLLSDRIGIMAKGRLKCIGTSLHLKNLYGSGYRINLTCDPGTLFPSLRNM